MRMSSLFLRTLRDDPADAEVDSHRLLVRAGYIRRIAAGIYSWLPLGYRVLRKAEQIVREEMDRAGAQEILMPIAQPLELWQRTGRDQAYGPMMFRLVDRKETGYCLSPTAEEVVTSIVAQEYGSYRDLPVNLYQINWKYRDELRPRVLDEGRVLVRSRSRRSEAELPSHVRRVLARVHPLRVHVSRRGSTVGRNGRL
jgi:prolyl-tRNA synthetase